MKTLRERFEAKYVIDDASGCWLWTAFVAPTGYAYFWVDGKNRLAHRVSYELFVGPIPEGLTIDHVRARGCIHRHCVNPAHLEPVTIWENTLRSDALPSLNSRKTHCDNGHAYDQANTYITKQGWRSCRTCHRDWSRKYALLREEAAA